MLRHPRRTQLTRDESEAKNASSPQSKSMTSELYDDNQSNSELSGGLPPTLCDWADPKHVQAEGVS